MILYESTGTLNQSIGCLALSITVLFQGFLNFALESDCGFHNIGEFRGQIILCPLIVVLAHTRAHSRRRYWDNRANHPFWSGINWIKTQQNSVFIRNSLKNIQDMLHRKHKFHFLFRSIFECVRIIFSFNVNRANYIICLHFLCNNFAINMGLNSIASPIKSTFFVGCFRA